MYQIFNEVDKNGLIPCVYCANAEQALLTAKALIAGGIYAAEFCGAGAAEGIKAIKAELKDFIAGASCIRTEDEADAMYVAGADYLTTSGYNDKIIEYCVNKDFPIAPAAATPGEVEKAVALGLHAIKLFPVDQIGKFDTIRILGSAYPSVKFIADGIICPEETSKYVELFNVMSCVVHDVAPESLIMAGKYDEITANAKAALASMFAFKLLHVGINTEDAAEAKTVNDAFLDAFNLSLRESPASYFADFAVEVMKGKGRGTMGHIGFSTSNVDKAVEYLERKGYTRDWTSRGVNAHGQALITYFNEELGGFAFHVSKR